MRDTGMEEGRNEKLEAQRVILLFCFICTG
jgi:hypothetical protein